MVGGGALVWQRRNCLYHHTWPLSTACIKLTAHLYKLHICPQEIDVDVSLAVNVNSALLEQLSEWVAAAAVAARSTLRSLRLSGHLHLGTIFRLMAPHAEDFKKLEVRSLVLGSGARKDAPQALLVPLSAQHCPAA